MKSFAYASSIALLAIGIRSIPSVTVTVPFGQGNAQEAAGSQQARPETAPADGPYQQRPPLAAAADEHRTRPLHLAGIEVPGGPLARPLSEEWDGQWAPPGEAWAALLLNR